MTNMPATKTAIPLPPTANFDQDTLAKFAQAKQAGVPDDINYSHAMQYQQSKTQQPQQPSSAQGFTDSLFPLVGGVAGGLLGSPLGPGGAIAGGAAGSGFGDFIRQLLTKGKKGVDTGSIAKETALGGVGGIGGELLGPVLKAGGKLLGEALPNGLDKAGSEFIASQYNVPRSAARALNLNDTVDTLSKYGINNINDVVPAADQVTGANGVVSQVVRKAVSQAGPVDTTGILDLANSVAANPAIPHGQDKKIVDFVKSGLNQMYGGSKGSIATGADPEETFNFIQQLEKKASEVNRIPQYQRTAQDNALKQSYTMMADELKQRLFQGAGADNAISKGLLTPEQYATLDAIHPQLAKDIQSAQTVKELRGIAAPFVKGSQLANETEAGSQIGFNNVGGALKGVGKLFQNPLNLIAEPLSTNAVNAGVGSTLKGVAGKMRGLPTDANLATIKAILGQGGVQAGANGGQMLSPTDKSGAVDAQVIGAMNGTDQNSSTPQGMLQSDIGNMTADPLRLALGSFMMKRAHTPQDMAAAYAFINPQGANNARPLSPQQQETKANALSGLRALNTVDTILQKDPNAPLKAKIPILSGRSPYSAAAKEVTDVYTRLRTGAALNNEEQKFYDSQLPQPFDSADTVQYKLSLFKDLFTKLANPHPASSDTGAAQAGY